MGRYRLVRRLASGGMAEVFLAKADGPMGFEKDLVVKRILPHLAESPRFIEMFLAEAKLAAQLNHPNIVQIFDFGEEKGTYFIAMEYVEGLNLRTLAQRAFRNGEMPPAPLVARIVSLACEGLAYAHEWVDPRSSQHLRLIHRDVSTDNILISRAGGVKVADFGIAKVNNGGPQTSVGVIKGKVSYLAPEYLMGQPIDLRVDVYALGVVLYEMLAGRKPFQAPSEDQLVQLIVHQPAVDIRTLRADVPEALARIIEQALTKDPARRYPNCRKMQADLERYLLNCGEPAGALQIADWMKALSLEVAEAPLRPLVEAGSLAATVPGRSGPKAVEAPEASQPIGWMRRPRTWALAAATVVPLGMVMFAVMQLRSEPASAPASAPASEPEFLTPPALLPESARSEAVRSPPASKLTATSAREALAKQATRIMECGVQFRHALPADRRVMVRVGVSNSGAVRYVTAYEPASLSPLLAQCLEQRIGQAKFPSNDNRPEFVVELPLRFNDG